MHLYPITGQLLLYVRMYFYWKKSTLLGFVLFNSAYKQWLVVLVACTCLGASICSSQTFLAL